MSVVYRAVVLSLLVVGVPPGARHGLIAQASQGTPTFPSGVDLITVDALVLDGKGRPVTGLGRDDFVVTEGDRQQEIASFEAFEAEPTARAASEDAPVATGSAPASPGRAYAVLLDDVWIPPLDVPDVRAALARFLEGTVRDGDEVRLATTSGDVRWSARIPDGREDLLAVVSRFEGRGPAQGRGKEVFAGRQGLLDTMSEYQAHLIVTGRKLGNNAIAEEVDARRRARMKLTLGALQREVEALSQVRGRKSLLLVTQGFIQDAGPELRESTRIAHEANVAIYFLDTRGLLITPGYSAEQGRASDHAGVGASLIEQEVHDTAGAQDLATNTGGFSVRNANDLAPGMERIAAESRAFYLLGFHPAPGQSAGEWRKLHIAVRRPGLSVRARPGYVWTPPSDRAGPLSGAAPIPVRLASFALGPVDAERTRVAVAVEIDTAQLPSEGEGIAPLKLRLEAIPRDANATYTHDLTLERSATPAEPRLSAGWRVARADFALPQDVYRIRAEVEDREGGRRGVLEQRVVVPGQGLFRVSTPILSDAVAASEDGTSVPATVAHRSFGSSGGRPLLYGFSVLGAAKDAATGHPDVSMRLVLRDRSGRVLVQTPDSKVDVSPEGRLEQVVGLPLAQMPAGEYELALAVQDRVAGGTVERKETFVVEAATPPAGVPAKGAAAPVSHAPPPAADLVPLLERAGRYVTEYREIFSNLVAEEHYEQRVSSRSGLMRRDSRADMVFVSLPGPIPWAVFRDVYEVGGKKVRDREARLERLFRDAPDGAVKAAASAKAILEESARFNLGPVRRTLNIPTFALLVLHPDNQHRFWFGRTGKKSIDGIETVQIAFAEKVRPTLVAGAQGDVTANGSVWIDPGRGTVLRTEVWYRPAGEDRYSYTLTRIVTEYAREPRLLVTVPVRMTEKYQSGMATIFDDAGRPVSGFTIEAVAQYSGYRRFEVTTDVQADPPKEDR